MDNQPHRIWTHGITLAAAIVFGISVFIVPPVLAGSKGKAKGHNNEWKQDRDGGEKYQKKHREMEREAHKYGQEQEHGVRTTEREREMEEREYGRESDREDRPYEKTRKRENQESMKMQKPGQED
jgi:hypothetical protein